MASDPFKISGVCLVGAGHAVHASLAVLDINGIKNVRIFSSFGTEAEKFKNALAENGGVLTAKFASHLSPSGLVRVRPGTHITNKAQEALEGVNVILLLLPSFAYENVFKSLKDFLRPGMVICVSPGQGGLSWIAKNVLGDELFNSITIFALSPMPFNCRVSEFGKHVDVQAFKKKLWVFTSPVSATPTAISVSEQLYGVKAISRGHLMSACLLGLNSNIHPQRLYSLLKDYKEGDILHSNPFFYEDMTVEATDLMERTSNELQEISQALQLNGIECDIPTIAEAEVFKWPSEVKDIGDCPEELVEIYRQCPHYKGFHCPFLEVAPGQWKPDFSNRFFTEDIPFGLCVIKGVAEIVNVETPTIDTIIYWAQNHMKKCYLNENKELAGIDVIQTFAPQRFGIVAPEQLL